MFAFFPLVRAPILYSPPESSMKNAEPILNSDLQSKVKKKEFESNQLEHFYLTYSNCIACLVDLG